MVVCFGGGVLHGAAFGRRCDARKPDRVHQARHALAQFLYAADGQWKDFEFERRIETSRIHLKALAITQAQPMPKPSCGKSAHGMYMA